MNWWRRVVRRNRLESDLDKELRDHMERHVADLVFTGMPEAEARRQARIEFGGMDQIKDECREVRGTLWLGALAQDLRFAWRGFRRDKSFAGSALMAIAIAVGAATAVFSVVDRSLFRALPYRQADRLVSVGVVAPVIHAQDWVFAGTYLQWKASRTESSSEAFGSPPTIR